MIRVGVIGFGYWGVKLARNFFIPGRAEVVAVCDLDSARLALAVERYPGLATRNDVRDTVQSLDIDAVVIATPARSHFEIALAALRAGKHVLISKPMTETSDQAKRLIEEAERRHLVILVDHTFVFTSAVQKIGEMIQEGHIGEFRRYDSTRVNLGLGQSDVNVLWDLAIHDLAILDFVLNARPLAVSVTGASNIPGSPESLAYMTLLLPQGATAHIDVNWFAPHKLREIIIGGSRKAIVYDEMRPGEMLRIHDKSGALAASTREGLETRVDDRLDQMTIAPLASREALANEAEHFVHCVQTGAAPVSGGGMALRLIEILEQATLSMRQGGRLIELA